MPLKPDFSLKFAGTLSIRATYAGDTITGITGFGIAVAPGAWQPGMVRKKKVERWLEKLKRVPGLSDAERAAFAVSLASTPDERWERMQQFLSWHTSSKPSKANESDS